MVLYQCFLVTVHSHLFVLGCPLWCICFLHKLSRGCQSTGNRSDMNRCLLWFLYTSYHNLYRDTINEEKFQPQHVHLYSLRWSACVTLLACLAWLTAVEDVVFIWVGPLCAGAADSLTFLRAKLHNESTF